ncbi:hypothetical protein [Paracoccus sp. ME4]|uniref:hypothetical protein n=1 Tax=Paracoccus sp. ME4 TaxID=3138066 RepID=UPI00398A55F9
MTDQLFIDEDGDACLAPIGRDKNLVALPARDEDGSILNPKAWRAMVDAYNRAAVGSAPRELVGHHTGTHWGPVLASAPQDQQAEAVAWLYERRGFRPVVSQRRPDYADLVSLQPLFTHPAPQDQFVTTLPEEAFIAFGKACDAAETPRNDALRSAAQTLLVGAETGSLAALHHAISDRLGLVDGSDEENELFEALLDGLRQTGARAASESRA